MWSTASPHIRGQGFSPPPRAEQGSHPHSATPVGPGRALPTPSLCGGTEAVPSPLSPAAVGADPTDRVKREVPLQSASAERRRPKAVGRQKEAVDGQGCPALSRSPFPPQSSGKRNLLREGAAPAILQSSGAAALCPKSLSSPLQAPANARVTHRLPFSRPLPPLSRSPLAPTWALPEKKKEPRPPQRGRGALLLKRLGRPFRERCPVPTGSRCRGPGPFAGWRWASPRRAGGGRRTPRAGRRRPRQGGAVGQPQGEIAGVGGPVNHIGLALLAGDPVVAVAEGAHPRVVGVDVVGRVKEGEEELPADIAAAELDARS